MSTASAAALTTLLGDKIHLPSDVAALRLAYAGAKPFPHVVIDNLFSEHLLNQVLAEAPAMAREQWLNVEQKDLEKIVRMRSAVEVGEAGAQLVALLHSAAFLYLLSEITGIWQLLPDPYLQGGGHALMRPGGYFKVHADRNIAYDTGLTRRLALIIYLNKNWLPEYRGELELWNSAGTQCQVSVEPLFNKTILFEVAYPNYHGVPEPLACPPDRLRQSFLVYYHTVGVGGGDKVTPHTSMFAPAFYRRKKTKLRLLAEQVTPPFVVNVARKLIKR
jgi:hypothetical protein